MEVQISPKYPSEYMALPCQSQSIHFSIRADSGAWIGISTKPVEAAVEPTITIGGYSNSKTGLVSGNNFRGTNFKNIRLEDNKFLDFWLKWDDGRIRFGVGTNDEPLINQSLEELIGRQRSLAIRNTRFFCIAMSGEGPGTWIIRDDGLNGLNPKWTKPKLGGIPHGALIAGFEDGSPLYVGRRYNGDLLVEKVHPTLTDLIVPEGNFEILSGIKNPLWETVHEGSTVPPRALVAGFNFEGEPVYVGRARYKMGIAVGKVEGAAGFKIMEENDMVSLTPYQVLVVPEKQ